MHSRVPVQCDCRRPRILQPDWSIECTVTIFDFFRAPVATTAASDFPLNFLNDDARKVNAREQAAASDPAWTENVHFDELVTNNVETNQEHPVVDELGPYDFDDSQHFVRDLDRLACTARVHVAARVACIADTAEGSILSVARERLSVHYKDSYIALHGRGQVLLGDAIPIAENRIDHLI